MENCWSAAINYIPTRAIGVCDEDNAEQLIKESLK